MKTSINIEISTKEKTTYSEIEIDLGKIKREFSQQISAKEAKNKTLAALEEVKQEVIEIFNREIEKEAAVLAAAKAEEDKVSAA